MYKISEVISKPVYTVYEGIKIGTILDFAYDNKYKKIRGFFIFDDESDGESYIEARKIYKFGSDNLLIKNRNKVQIPKLDKKSILNLSLISIEGDNAGDINDVYFDEKFKATAIETKLGVIIPADTLISIGQDSAIFDINDKKINIARMKPASKIVVEELPNIKVKILEEDKLATVPIVSSKSENNFSIPKIGEAKPVAKKNITLPPKVSSNNNSILGKYSKDLLCGLNGEVIVKKGQLITEEIYKKAQKHSKLFELMNCV